MTLILQQLMRDLALIFQLIKIHLKANIVR